MSVTTKPPSVVGEGRGKFADKIEIERWGEKLGEFAEIVKDTIPDPVGGKFVEGSLLARLRKLTMPNGPRQSGANLFSNEAPRVENVVVTQPRVSPTPSSESASGLWGYSADFYLALDATNKLVQHWAEPANRASLETFAGMQGSLGDAARNFLDRLTAVESGHAGFLSRMLDPKLRNGAAKNLTETVYPEVQLLQGHDFELIDIAYHKNVVDAFHSRFQPIIDALKRFEIQNRGDLGGQELYRIRLPRPAELQDFVDLQKPENSFLLNRPDKTGAVDILVSDVNSALRLEASLPAVDKPRLNVRIGPEWPVYRAEGLSAERRADVTGWLGERGLVLDSLSFTQQRDLVNHLAQGLGSRNWGLADLQSLIGRNEMIRLYGVTIESPSVDVPRRRASGQ